MDYLWLTILTGVAIDFAIRILRYSKTKDEKYKHEHLWWLK